MNIPGRESNGKGVTEAKENPTLRGELVPCTPPEELDEKVGFCMAIGSTLIDGYEVQFQVLYLSVQKKLAFAFMHWNTQIIEFPTWTGSSLQSKQFIVTGLDEAGKPNGSPVVTWSDLTSRISIERIAVKL